jgi:hypothetical protein
MILKKNSKPNISSTTIVQLKMRRKKVISNKMRLHSEMSMGILLLITIIRFHFNNYNNNSSNQLRLSISIRNQLYNISTKQIQAKATFHKVEWSMEEVVRAPMSVLTNRGSVPSRKLQLIFWRQTEKVVKERESANTLIHSTKLRALTTWMKLQWTLPNTTQLPMALIKNLIIANSSKVKPFKLIHSKMVSIKGGPLPETCFLSSASKR